MDAPEACGICGRPLTEAHTRDVRFEYPDVVFALGTEERDQRLWRDAGVMTVQGLGAFVRVLLPVRLVDGDAVYGVWLQVDDSLAKEAWTNWERPEYSRLELRGKIANAIPPW